MKTPLLLSIEEIQEIELRLLARSRSMVRGDRRSVFLGTAGYNLAGIRDWEPGDQARDVDWAKSALKDFAPLQIREKLEERTLDVVIAADASASTRCGTASALIGKSIAATIATIGFSAVFAQDRVGLVGFTETATHTEYPRGGKKQILRILDQYQRMPSGLQNTEKLSLARVFEGALKRPGVIAVVSDFLSDTASACIEDLRSLQGRHDIFLVVVDATDVFRMPDLKTGWVRCQDAESGSIVVLSGQEIRRLVERVQQYQSDIIGQAQRFGLDPVRVKGSVQEIADQLAEFFDQRQVRYRS